MFVVSKHFNPRSRKGSDCQFVQIHIPDLRFQSTLPQGERRIRSFHFSRCMLYFNPRSRKGSDLRA